MSGIPLVKICEECGLDYRRPTGSARISDQKWADRRFCSSYCAITDAGKKGSDGNRGPLAAFDGQNLSATRATAELLKRQMGMYQRMVAAHGLQDVWEAAARCGMAA